MEDHRYLTEAEICALPLELKVCYRHYPWDTSFNPKDGLDWATWLGYQTFLAEHSKEEAIEKALNAAYDELSFIIKYIIPRGNKETLAHVDPALNPERDLELCNKATEGPWEDIHEDDSAFRSRTVIRGKGNKAVCCTSGNEEDCIEMSQEDADFMAAARTLLPDYIKAYLAQQALTKEVAKELIAATSCAEHNAGWAKFLNSKINTALPAEVASVKKCAKILETIADTGEQGMGTFDLVELERAARSIMRLHKLIAEHKTSCLTKDEQIDALRQVASIALRRTMCLLAKHRPDWYTDKYHYLLAGALQYIDGNEADMCIKEDETLKALVENAGELMEAIERSCDHEDLEYLPCFTDLKAALQNLDTKESQ